MKNNSINKEEYTEDFCQICGKAFKRKINNLNKNNWICKECSEQRKKENNERKLVFLKEENLRKRNYHPYICEHCGKEFTEDFRKDIKSIKDFPPRFCSRKCANARKMTNEKKKKISSTLIKRYLDYNHVSYSSNDYKKLQLTIEELKKQKDKEKQIKYKCIICGNPYISTLKKEKTKKYKGYCKKCALSAAGKHSSISRKSTRASKAEIYFRELCEKEGWQVIHNVAMFNGYDADVILPEFKVAVHWNGPWHYEGYIKNLKGFSYKQINNRDILKYKEIEKFGYNNYIIKYIEKFSEDKINKEFTKFLEYLKILQDRVAVTYFSHKEDLVESQ